ncbi:helicase-related protein [Stappia sp. ES.058]|uniref:helicase-related protein n=1 Tax=Stappia sp. ES.058 TaxID=1881061 RepID=UPI000879EF27|nr:helicase-related protein [Stappia sp. ES.058]SDU39019.1 ATP-dependent RNA helicase SUPV3L1/SUV3 [Stappia sp. ES.058]
MLHSPNSQLPPSVRARTVTAVLGPTNTGKTHLAIERMISRESGIIGLPLRLLAREVYGRIVARVGEDKVALVTGEEKVIPPDARYWVSTVEAMPLDLKTDFVAIDEVQLAGDLERGHVFTDRILNMRGHLETLLLGSATARPLLERLLPGLNVVTRPRMSVLAYSGQKKITRLPPRSAVVAFSSSEVYAIAELIRRQHGGAAVVLGSLSPRTRNAQVALFQNGDVQHLIATDAIGMGLNLDVDHIAFAGIRKFDGYQYRMLTPAEMGQIGGRAGRHTRDGTFGVTGRVDPFDDELVEALESHRFDALKVFQWRSRALDFSSVTNFRASLDVPPREQGLTRAPPSADETAFDHAVRDEAIRRVASSPERVRLLWDVCQVPDYRKIAPANHADLIAGIYAHLTRDGVVPDDWFARQVAFADKVDGDIDTLSNRMAHIRTWTFVANRADWLSDPAHWQGVTRGVEDRLSDALHDRLTQRFVDRRTSVLMRRLRENAMLEAEITPVGDVLVEGQHVGQLQGFRFAPDAAADGPDGKALRAAAQKALASELTARADKVARAGNEDFTLTSDGFIRWQGEVVARLIAGETVLSPGLIALCDDTLEAADREKVEGRLTLWLKAHIDTLAKPLRDLEVGNGLEGLARGVAFRLVESLGIVERAEISEDVRQLDQTMRAGLRRLGVRFGAHHIFVPALLKPAPSRLMAQLWALKHGDLEMPGLSELPQLSASGRTSVVVDPAFSKDLYKVVGFRVCGPRAVRVDILERLADLIRPLLAWKPLDTSVEPPEGAVPEGGAFTVTVAMTSLLGCAGEDFSAILKSLGYRNESREIQRPVAAVGPLETAAADVTPSVPSASSTETQAPAPETSASETSAPETSAFESSTAETPVAETPVAESAVADSSAVDPAAGPDTTDTSASGAGEVDASTAGTPTQAVTETGAPEESETAISDAAPGDVSAETPTDGADPQSPAQESDAPADATDAAAVETVTIEIWRPGRRDRRPRGGDKPGRRPSNRGGAARDGASAKGPGARDDQAPRRGGGKPKGKPRNPAEPSGRSSGAKSGGSRPDKASGRGGRPGKGGTIDPDSPFAKLAALKADMEKKPR